MVYSKNVLLTLITRRGLLGVSKFLNRFQIHLRYLRLCFYDDWKVLPELSTLETSKMLFPLVSLVCLLVLYSNVSNQTIRKWYCVYFYLLPGWMYSADVFLISLISHLTVNSVMRPWLSCSSLANLSKSISRPTSACENSMLISCIWDDKFLHSATTVVSLLLTIFISTVQLLLFILFHFCLFPFWYHDVLF